MKRSMAATGLLLFGMLGVLVADDKELKELEGSYTVVSMEKGGMPAPKDLTQKVKVVFKGDSLVINIGGDEKKAKIKADSAKQPHTIDISPLDGEEKGKTFPGIYKIEKGDLTLAFTEKTDRPKDFKSEGETILLKLKKDEKK